MTAVEFKKLAGELAQSDRYDDIADMARMGLFYHSMLVVLRECCDRCAAEISGQLEATSEDIDAIGREWGGLPPSKEH